MSKAAMIGIGAVALIVAAVIGGIGASLIGDDDNDAEETVYVEQAGSAPTSAAPGDAAQGGAIDPDDAGEVADAADVETGGVDVDDQPIPAGERAQAERAVLQIAGGGTITDLSFSDDPGERYEAEVVRDDGSEVDIALDERFDEVPNQPYED
ncbi:hypothetical protein HJD18_01515 [Thermoleophilia bacterium SCSIO 60948]|nr:hypothetical protein HJD18_01515 [Thermoleophilia bacterium SCSIO 60948]